MFPAGLKGSMKIEVSDAVLDELPAECGLPVEESDNSGPFNDLFRISSGSWVRRVKKPAPTVKSDGDSMTVTRLSGWDLFNR